MERQQQDFQASFQVDTEAKIVSLEAEIDELEADKVKLHDEIASLERKLQVHQEEEEDKLLRCLLKEASKQVKEVSKQLTMIHRRRALSVCLKQGTVASQ
jgi:septal ring factor EnvC (AmiA/AmiB activator)